MPSLSRCTLALTLTLTLTLTLALNLTRALSLEGQVAHFRPAHGQQDSRYVLRAECWDEVDVYYSRWPKHHMQEAKQRYAAQRGDDHGGMVRATHPLSL